MPEDSSCLATEIGEWFSTRTRRNLERYITGEKVGPKLWRSIGVTMRLLAGSVLLAVLFGVLIGVVAALRQYSKFDYLATLFAFVFFSMRSMNKMPCR